MLCEARSAARLDVFLCHWGALGWPARLLSAELRSHIKVAAPALCWLLEHRPLALSEVPLPPDVLLAAIAADTRRAAHKPRVA
jgi:hypothetical protein